MKNSPSNPAAVRPDGRLGSEQGYPNGPQGPFGEPCEGKPLRTPDESKPAKPKRTRVIKVRLTTEEMNRLVVPLRVKGVSRRGLSQLVRTRLFAQSANGQSTLDYEQCRLLAAVLNSLNLVARCSLAIGSPEAAVEVIAQLASVEREIRNAFNLRQHL